MASTHIHIRIDEETKRQAQQVFSDMELDITTAVTMFIRQAIRNRSFPFQPSADPFFSESNMAHLAIVKADSEAGRNMTVHDIVED